MTVEQPAPAVDRIVVGVDGSAPSHLALRWAVFLARATGSAVEAVAAWHPLRGDTWAGIGFAAVASWDPAEYAGQAVVDALDAVFGDGVLRGLTVTVREDHPAQVLMDVSAGARMLVVGSRGHEGFAGLLLGSVSAACAEHGTCPVLVTHGDSLPPAA